VHKARHPPRPPISQPHRLVKYADEHVVYELEMFFGAVRSRSLTVAATTRSTVGFFSNARVEAFANHLRNLITFLYPGPYPVRKGDVAAHHFLPGPAPYARWCRVRPQLSRTLKRAKERADKELAHLTDKRISGVRAVKAWDFVGLGNEVRDVLQIFLGEADPARLGTAVRAAIPNGAL
jgi:hypothetical protein